MFEMEISHCQLKKIKINVRITLLFFFTAFKLIEKRCKKTTILCTIWERVNDVSNIFTFLNLNFFQYSKYKNTGKAISWYWSVGI